MISIGTPFTSSARKILLLGSGELGKEVVIELQRLGCEVIACDRYANAPAMQVADHSHVLDMTDAAALNALITSIKPDLIVPEIEAIATDELLALEQQGFNIIPTAKAVSLTMNREGIRNLVAQELKITTSNYRYADTEAEFNEAISTIGLPCVVKPIMSSSGKGQSLITEQSHIQPAWQYAQSGGRTGAGRVIIEGFVDFDYEITLLTVRHQKGTSFCQPIGHRQESGDYKESWQPQAMSEIALSKAKQIAQTVTDALGGYGIFGVELFIKNDEVIFSEVSPRPHDTGLVTLISQDLSEFALHAYAILGLPIKNIHFHGPSASAVIMAKGESSNIEFYNLEAALCQSDTQVRLFGKPEVNGERRMGVALSRANTVEEARAKAMVAAESVNIQLN